MVPKKQIAQPIRIEITPSPSEYGRLCRDLKTLRRKGATSNTAAILDAVRAAAAKDKIDNGSTNGKGAQTRPQPPQQEG